MYCFSLINKLSLETTLSLVKLKMEKIREIILALDNKLIIKQYL